ncbi:MAG TPA: M3 family metallopeptidase [Casimicrobiaceae bacterium]|nr:M3 family metallopeptidase [Casimicrobiaceae bacterium]
MTDRNPLLEFDGLTRFDAFRVEHVTPAVDALLADARSAVEAVATSTAPPTWDRVVEPMETALDHLDRAWSAVRNLNGVVNTPALRDAFNLNLPRITAFYTDIAQDVRLYARFRALAQSPEYARLDAPRKRAIDNQLRDFRLGGAELAPPAKARLKEVQETLAQLGAKFDDNVLDAQNAWALYVDNEAELSGIPEDVIVAARHEAEAEGRDGYKLTLRYPCFMPVMQYADSREVRAMMHRGFATLASELGERPEWDNTGIITRILELRREEAMLLGYPNYAELSLVPKMARSADEVLAFLRDLAKRARPFAQRDYAELETFAREALGIEIVEPWDLAYASEKLKHKRFDFSEQELRQYFSEERVLAGLFRVVESIYGLDIRPANAPTWHPTVRFYEIHNGNGALIGQFYMDLYAREGKQSGAWADDAVVRRRSAERLQLPVAYLTCNFSAPLPGKPALFTHRDVITLFHEFGHGLHHLLTQVDVAAVSGLHGVEWDAVELPSQFMENFTWEWDVLRNMTAHVATGEPLPRALFDRMIAARNFQSGLATVRQLEFALFDMLLHSAYRPGEAQPYASPQAVLDAARDEVAVAPRAPYDRFMHAFGHIFAGGYAAGYYSYKWAEVLSADAYSLFEEYGVLSRVAGTRFLDEVLARGGSRPAMESFIAFRGRPPQIDALLRHNGMTVSS